LKGTDQHGTASLVNDSLELPPTVRARLGRSLLDDSTRDADLELMDCRAPASEVGRPRANFPAVPVSTHLVRFEVLDFEDAPAL
jgi:hypothetical protein